MSWYEHQEQKPPIAPPEGHTRIRLVDDDGETIGIIWTAGDVDRDYIRSLIPDGCKAMVARNVWPA